MKRGPSRVELVEGVVSSHDALNSLLPRRRVLMLLAPGPSETS